VRTRCTAAGVGFLSTLCIAAVNELVEVALSTRSRLFLVHEFEIVLVEFLKELIPRYFSQVLVLLVLCAREAKPQDSWLALPMRAGYFGRSSAPGFSPSQDFLVVFSGFRKRHKSPSKIGFVRYDVRSTAVVCRL